MSASSIFLSEYTKIITASDIADQDLGIQIGFPCFQEDLIVKLLDEVLTNLKSLPIVYNLKSDLYIVGDLHGNIRDLIRIMKQIDFFDSGAKILFLGDYVDRGDFSVEVITLLFSLISQYPDRIFLLRGNHEFSSINMNYGFKEQLQDMYNTDKLWMKFNEVFNWLPIAAIIDNNLFCVHGGISRHLKSIDQIRALERPIVTFQDNNLLADLMWSDPSNTVSFYLDSERGYGCIFGQDAVINFCRNQKMEKIIRAHQCVATGIEEILYGKIITVFSCSNYCDNCQNLAGYLYINGKAINQVQLEPLAILKRQDTLFRNCSRKSGNDLFSSPEILRNSSLNLLGNSFNTGIKGSNRKLNPIRRKSCFSQSFSRNLPIPLAAMHMGSSELLYGKSSNVSLAKSSHFLCANDSLQYNNNSNISNSQVFTNLSSLPPLPLILETPEERPIELESTHLPKKLK